MKSKVFGLLTLVVALFASGCVPSSSSAQTYTRGSVGQVSSVQEGEVTFLRQVQIEGTKSGVGTVAGGALGYALGRTVGGGSGKKLAKTAGAVGGAAAGAMAEEGATREMGLEITVELDSGEVVVVVQAADQAFAVGDQVRVIRHPNGSARVSQ